MTASASFFKTLEPRLGSEGFSATWLNHYSALNADWDAVRNVDFVGVDGTLLQLLLARSGITVMRTSADLALPELLAHETLRGARLALIGGAIGVAQKAGDRLRQNVVFVIDGYHGLKTLLDEPADLIMAQPEIVLIGVGAGLQDRVAVDIAQLLPNSAVFTVGGWLDQLALRPQYFPPLIHRLRIGWLWRVIHEPKRLIRRYTLDAFSAVVRRRQLTAQLGQRELVGRVLLAKKDV